MEKEKKEIRISLSQFLLLIVIGLLVIIGCVLIYSKVFKERKITFEQTMELFYPKGDLKCDIFDSKTEVYEYTHVTNRSEGECDSESTYISYSYEDSSLNIKTHEHFSGYGDDYYAKDLTVSVPEKDVVNIVLKTYEASSANPEFIFCLTREGNLYYYTAKMFWDENAELEKFEGISKVVNIELGSTLMYDLEASGEEFVCGDGDGVLIATTFDGTAYKIYPETHSVGPDGDVTTYPATFEKINKKIEK